MRFKSDCSGSKLTCVISGLLWCCLQAPAALPVPAEQVEPHDETGKGEQAELDLKAEHKFYCGQVEDCRLALGEIADADGDASGKKSFKHVRAPGQHFNGAIQI